jgi:hypothetical protein
VPCINQYPLLVNVVKEEIKKEIQPKIENCFFTAKTRLESRGYQVNQGEMNIEVDLIFKKVKINIEKKIDISRNGATRTYREFKVELLHPIYDLINIASKIIEDEIELCNFKYDAHMLLYPDYKIEVNSINFAKLYKITERNSNKFFRLAIKSCVTPGGF